METQEKELLNVREVAALLDLSPRTVWRWSDSGRMPRPVRLSSLAKWRMRELREWIDNGCKPIRASVA